MRLQCPAFVDLQVNGFAGVDFNAASLDADDVHRAVSRLQDTGVTRFLPTLITSPIETFARNARLLSRLATGAIAGLHMEGPYLSPEDGPRGAHPREHLADASLDDFERRQEAAAGRIVLVTLAPEVPGAIRLIGHLVRQGVRVAIGHTAASPEVLAEAIEAGASLATHLGNGCAAVLPRHPNVIWELAAADAVRATLIVDGHHLPPATVKSLIRAKGAERTILISDAIAAAGQLPGRYTIGSVTGELGEDGRVSLPGTAYLAGSALTMPQAVANAVRFAGVPLDSALAMASTHPAGFLGIEPRGHLDIEWTNGTLIVRAAHT